MLEIKASFTRLNYSSGTGISREGRTGCYTSGALQAEKYICPKAPLHILLIIHYVLYEIVCQGFENKGGKMPEVYPMSDKASASKLQDRLFTVQSQASQQ